MSKRGTSKTGLLIQISLVMPAIMTWMATGPASSQTLIPSSDGTGTLVTPNGSNLDITGGKLSTDRGNLFHSFQEFNLTAGQTANFISSPELRNILTRISGGNASHIDGRLQISGGNPNLYLMNPAGMIFGPNASLNVPASFFATTASSIGFNNGTFNATGPNNYTSLAGNPNTFNFPHPESGNLINSANLAVSAGQNISLIAGTVINTGTLTAPAGSITIAAVPGQNLVRLSQPGMVLSLDIQTTPETQPNNITPLSIPQLLTGIGNNNATGLTLNPDGSVSLTASQTPIPTTNGTAIISGNLNISHPNISSPTSTVGIFGEKIALMKANINANSPNGSNILIGGDFQGKGNVPNALRTFISQDTTLNANAIEGTNNGRIIIWANEITGFYGNINALGGTSGNGGFVEVSGKETLIFKGKADVSAPNGAAGTLLLDPRNIRIARNAGTDSEPDTALPDILLTDFPDTDITISAATLENQSGNIVLEATENITLDQNISLTFVPGGSITFRANLSGSGTGAFSMSNGQSIVAPGRNIEISAASVNLGSVDTSSADDGGSIRITTANGILNTGNLTTNSTNTGRGGDIILSAGGTNANININPGTLDASSVLGNGGNISLTTADGDINVNDLITQSSLGTTSGNITINAGGNGVVNINNNTLTAGSITGTGGAISITTANGDINLRNLITAVEGSGDAGPITVSAGGVGNINNIPGTINASSATGNGGNVTFTTNSGGINTNTITTTSGGAGNGGDITLIVNGSQGALNTSGTLDVSSFAGTAGTITLRSGGRDINTQDINALGVDGGTIDINAGTGSVNLNGTTIAEDMTLTGDNIGLNAGAGSIIGTGNITIRPATPGRNIDIGTNTESTTSLDLNTAELPAITGFTRLNIGRDDGTGTIYLGDFAAFGVPVNINGATTLVGPNRNTTWDIIGNNSGSISGYPLGLTWTNIPNLTGGTANDSFVYYNGATISGQLADLGNNFTTSTATDPTVEPPEPSPVPPETPNPSPVPPETPNPSPVPPETPNPSPVPPETPDPSPVPPETPNPSPVPPETPNPSPVPPETPNPSPGTGGTPNPSPGTGGTPNPSPVTGGTPNPSPVTGETPTFAEAPPQQGVTAPSLPVTNAAPQPPATALPVPSPQGNNAVVGGGSVGRPLEGGGVSQGNSVEGGGRENVPMPQEAVNAANSFLVQEKGQNSAQSSPNGDARLSRSERENEISGPTAFNQQFLPIRLVTRNEIEDLLRQGNVMEAVRLTEQFYSEEFEDYLGQKLAVSNLSFAGIQETLRSRSQQTGIQSAIVYIFARDSQLDLLLVPMAGEPIYKTIPQANRATLMAKVQEFQQEIGNPVKRRTNSYAAASQQLYEWMIAPLLPDLERLGVQSLMFSMDGGLRSLPIAALYDGKQFLVEKYSLSLVPSLNLTDVRYANIKNVPLLAMGMSEFSDQPALPGVPVELQTITQQLWKGEAFLNQSFTLQTLQEERQNRPFGIIHIATHGEFQPGQLENSYIQMWDKRLTLNLMGQLKWNDPPVELLVLSACRTAIGDRQAEFGFAGLAVQAGVKTAVASLWYANDAGTLGLMAEFYKNLQLAPVKAEALRQAQIAMLRGDVVLDDGFLVGTFGKVPLPTELEALGNRDLKHPYYWAGFTMIGSPW
ncbi:CHAT domain-containing protein [Ancylothrix sp. C2]|uniref:CHAT domain-containing protein n=1 Tax=Ancylothrix sp. D3o TaxID=2953691 RepID=UPI0021BB047C|nr:CHAT domain-containing protein [Ancylothrix sp. D3o]MCT7948626.1 CHAT domain-containing protein [Ancylothrix sp. D3o]